jgi:hypothetical protein
MRKAMFFSDTEKYMPRGFGIETHGNGGHLAVLLMPVMPE